jgi:uncharacterized protein YlzI (FlbEa/FlbD family)
MTLFLELTVATRGRSKKIFVNTDRIISIQAYPKNCTSLAMSNGDSFNVKETPSNILARLNEGAIEVPRRVGGEVVL